MSKLTKEQKDMIRNVAKGLPTFQEKYITRKNIHNKDIESYGLQPKDYDKNKQYQAGYKDGIRIVDSDVHYKRLCKAFKKDGENGYREYLIKFSKKSFRDLTITERLMNWIKS